MVQFPKLVTVPLPVGETGLCKEGTQRGLSDAGGPGSEAEGDI